MLRFAFLTLFDNELRIIIFWKHSVFLRILFLFYQIFQQSSSDVSGAEKKDLWIQFALDDMLFNFYNPLIKNIFHESTEVGLTIGSSVLFLYYIDLCFLKILGNFPFFSTILYLIFVIRELPL